MSNEAKWDLANPIDVALAASEVVDDMHRYFGRILRAEVCKGEPDSSEASRYRLVRESLDFVRKDIERLVRGVKAAKDRAHKEEEDAYADALAMSENTAKSEADVTSVSPQEGMPSRTAEHVIEECLRLIEVVGGQRPCLVNGEEPTWVIDGFELERRLRAMIAASSHSQEQEKGDANNPLQEKETGV